MTATPKVLIATDGSGTSSGPGGWAAVLRCGENAREISGNAAEATNNTMELTAAIMALRYLQRPCVVELTTDSEYLLKGITQYIQKWKRNDWRTSTGDPVRNRELWEQLNVEVSRHAITWIWMRGHAGHADNERCDELAGAERQKLLPERPEPKKRKRKVFNLDGIDDKVIKEALEMLPAEKLERLRRFLVA